MSELHRAIETEIRDARSILEALAGLLADDLADTPVLAQAKALVALRAVSGDLEDILADLEQAAGVEVTP